MTVQCIRVLYESATTVLVYVCQDSLSDEVLALRSQEVVLTVLRQLYDGPILCLKLAVLHEAAHLNVQALWRVHVLCQVQPTVPNATHVHCQGAIVPATGGTRHLKLPGEQIWGAESGQATAKGPIPWAVA